MSAAAGRLARGPAALAARIAEPPRAGTLRLLIFAACAAFVSGHRALLLEDPPVAALAAAVLVSVALGAALMSLRRLRLSRAAVHGASLALTLAAAALALVVAGLPAALLAPAGWDELVAALGRGIAGLQSVNWPYAGADEWVRLVIVLSGPAALIVAAAFTFWPVRTRAAALRALGLVTLLAAYGSAVTDHDPGEPMMRGLALLALVAAWLWLPRLRCAEAAPAALLVMVAAVLSLPLAARLDSDAPLIDYRAWNWFAGDDVTFDWNHSYGPLDWPREGTTLLEVAADRPHYWKAQTLDHFDGVRWIRSDAAERTRPLDELPPRPERRWDERIRVTVRALRTDILVAAGTPYLVTGAGVGVSGSADGTLKRLDEPLSRGDSYAVRTYDPDPSARELRASRGAYGPGLGHYTGIELPVAGFDLGRGEPRTRASAPVGVPLRGGALGGTPHAERRLAASPYRRTFRLARRLAGRAPTAYDAARRIERHLERSYSYSERPPGRRYPLESFLFRDRSGYCQQFSGAMALMLRMVGIPARVVTGFSPGSLNRDSGEYRVRDLDAHSWVEVFFNGIGWVTFDPTPPAAPAERPADDADAAAGAGESAGNVSSSPGARQDAAASRAAAADEPRGDGSESPIHWVLAGLALLGAGAVAALLWGRRSRAAAAPADAALRELERALPRLGFKLRPATTLLELEARLRQAAAPCAAAYVAALRAARFGSGRARALGPAERRALRRELTAKGGIRTRVRGFLALPPMRLFSRS